MLLGLVLLAWIGSPKTVDMAGNKIKKIDLQPLLHTDAAIGTGGLDNKLAVLHFWGTWCPPCQLEFPEFVELAERFAEEPQVQIVSVSCSSGPELDPEELRSASAKFMQKYPVAIPTYYDSTGLTRQQLAMLSNSVSFNYPTTILVDRDGTILASTVGYLEGEMERIGDLIASKLE